MLGQLILVPGIITVQMIQEGITFDHNFYVVVGKQWRTENVYTGHQHNILYKLTNVFLLFICFKLVLSF